MKKVKIGDYEIEGKYGFLVINGEYYKEESKRGEVKFKKINKKEVKKYEDKAKKIAKRLKDSLDKEAILKESLMRLERKDLDALYKILFESKRKYKAKTREHHCVDMKVGNFILPIVD